MGTVALSVSIIRPILNDLHSTKNSWIRIGLFPSPKHTNLVFSRSINTSISFEFYSAVVKEGSSLNIHKNIRGGGG